MIRISAAALATASLFAVSGAAAQPSHRPHVVAPAQPSPASLEAWMRTVYEWERPYIALNNDQSAFIQDLLQGGSKAAGYFSNSDAAGGAAWAKTWSADMSGRYGSLKTRAEAIATGEPPPAPAALAAELSRQPEVAGVLHGLSEGSHTIAGNVLSQEPLVSATIRMAAAAASGDHDAYAGLRSKMFDLEAAGLKGEIAVSSVHFSLPDDPETDSSNAVVHFDETMMAILQAAAAAYGGGAVDRAATAARLRQLAANTNADADAMERHAAARLRLLEVQPNTIAAQRAVKLMASVQTFPQQAVVERQLADAIRGMAALIEQPNSKPDDWINAIHAASTLTDQLSVFGQKRDALTAAAAQSQQ